MRILLTILKNSFSKIQIEVFYWCKLCLNIFTHSRNYICLGSNWLSNYIDTTEISEWTQTPKWDHFLPLIGCTSQDKINVFQLTYLSLLSLLVERHWSSHLGLLVISVSKTRKIKVWRTSCFSALCSFQMFTSLLFKIKLSTKLWNPLSKAVSQVWQAE